MCFDTMLAMWYSDKFCCICVKLSKSIKYIQALDILELLLNAAAIVLYLMFIRTSNLHLPLLVLVFGNLLAVGIRMVGNFLRWCGCGRLWTRSALSCARFFGLAIQVLLIAGQITFNWMVLVQNIRVEELPFMGKLVEG